MRNKGFTLLELSIVIVIIGLIVAGISAGQSLVKQAQLRSISSEIANFRTAINSFKLQYNDIPGDMTNAHDYWGALCDATPANCNGNGNDVIEDNLFPADTENLRAMQHLALAGLIDKQFSFPSEDCNNSTCPASSFPTGFYTFRGGESQIYNGENTIILGATRPSEALPITVLLTPPELQSLDSKMDDSVAGTGQIRGWAGRNAANTGWVSDCVTPDLCDRLQQGIACNYDLDVITQQCVILASP